MTERDRGKLRDRAVIATIAASFVIRVTTGLISLAVIALAARSLSQAELGLVLTLATMWFLVAGSTDLGIGAVLTTRVAKAEGNSDRERSRQAIGPALALSLAIGALVGVVGGVAAFALPWHDWIGGDLAPSIVAPAVAATLLTSGLTIPGAVGAAVLAGLQRQVASRVRVAFGTLLSLPVCGLAAHFEFPAWGFLAALISVPTVATLINTAWVLLIEYPDLTPRLRGHSSADLFSIVSVSGYVALARIGHAFAAGSGTIIVAAVQGPATAAIFGAAVRLFTPLESVVQGAGSSVWPPVTEAIARGDFEWAKRRYRQSVMLVSIAYAAGAVLLVIIGPWFVPVWLGEDIVTPQPFLALMGVSGLATMMLGQLFVLLLAIERLRAVGLAYVLVAPLTIAIGALLTRDHGIYGPVIASGATYLAILLPYCLRLVRRELVRLQ